jgi:hypothetical protein
MNLPMSLVTLVALAAIACSRDEAPSSEAERDRAFEEMMTNVSLVGHSTSFDRDGITGEEEYAIEKVSRIAGEKWLFQTRLKIGSRDVTVLIPIPLTILWAGDTPVITLTDLSIPGLGTYSARVLLFRDSYSGTWTGGDGGGHVFGRIVRRDD